MCGVDLFRILLVSCKMSPVTHYLPDVQYRGFTSRLVARRVSEIHFTQTKQFKCLF